MIWAYCVHIYTLSFLTANNWLESKQASFIAQVFINVEEISSSSLAVHMLWHAWIIDTE